MAVTNDIEIRNINVQVPDAVGTHDVTITALTNPTDSFIIWPNVQFGCPAVGVTNNMEPDESGFTAEVLNATTVRLKRVNSAAGNQARYVKCTVMSFKGSPGSPNEFRKRAEGDVAVDSTTSFEGDLALTGVVDPDMCIPFIQGIRSQDNNANRAIMVLRGSAQLTSISNARFYQNRSMNSGFTHTARLNVIEFIGSNWDVGHAILVNKSGDLIGEYWMPAYDGSGSGEANSWRSPDPRRTMFFGGLHIYSNGIWEANDNAGINRWWAHESWFNMIFDSSNNQTHSCRMHALYNAEWWVDWLAGGGDAIDQEVNVAHWRIDSADESCVAHFSMTSDLNGYNRDWIHQQWHFKDATTLRKDMASVSTGDIRFNIGVIHLGDATPATEVDAIRAETVTKDGHHVCDYVQTQDPYPVESFLINSATQRGTSGETGTDADKNNRQHSGSMRFVGRSTVGLYRYPFSGAENAYRFSATVMGYEGDPGGRHEFKVRGKGSVYLYHGSGNESSNHIVPNVANLDKCAVMPAGVFHQEAAADLRDLNVSWDIFDNSGNIVVKATGGESGTGNQVQAHYYAVEFIGQAWNLQKVTKTLTSYNDTLDITAVEALDKALLIPTQNSDPVTAAPSRIRENCGTIHWNSTSQLQFTYDSNVSDLDMRYIIYILENPEWTISRYYDAQSVSNADIDVTSLGLVDQMLGALMTAKSGNSTGNGIGRGTRGCFFTSLTNLRLHNARSGGICEHRVEVIDFQGMSKLAPDRPSLIS